MVVFLSIPLKGPRHSVLVFHSRGPKHANIVQVISFSAAMLSMTCNSRRHDQCLQVRSLHTPNMTAAVPVVTPINHCNVLNLTASNLSLRAADSCSILVSVSLIFKS